MDMCASQELHISIILILIIYSFIPFLSDISPPTFTTGCPHEISLQIDISIASHPVYWPELNATDPSSPLRWVSSHQPGDSFPVGNVTIVTYTVTDEAGNLVSCNFSVALTGISTHIHYSKKLKEHDQHHLWYVDTLRSS